jgi:hypothetical protein
MTDAWLFTNSTLPFDSECSLEVHASEYLIDALGYASGMCLHRVELDPIALHDKNHITAESCRCIARYHVPTWPILQLALEAVGLVAWCSNIDTPSWHSARAAFERCDIVGAYCALGRLAKEVLDDSMTLASEALSTVARQASDALYSAHCQSWYWATRAAYTVQAAITVIGHIAKYSDASASLEARECAYAKAYEAARDCLEKRAVTLFTKGWDIC